MISKSTLNTELAKNSNSSTNRKKKDYKRNNMNYMNTVKMTNQKYIWILIYIMKLEEKNHNKKEKNNHHQNDKKYQKLKEKKKMYLD